MAIDYKAQAEIEQFVSRIQNNIKERLDRDIDNALAEFKNSMEGVMSLKASNQFARGILIQFYEALND